MEAYWDLIKRIIKESDIVIEVLDARLIEMSRNKEVEKLVKDINRPLLFVINKFDLVDDKKDFERGIKYLKEEGEVVFVSAKKPKDVKIILYAIKKIFGKYGKREKEDRIFGSPKNKTREAKGDIVVGILGYPNVGKSSIINAIAHKKKVKVSKKAGTTHGIHWIKATNKIKIIDSPGVIPLKEEVKFFKDSQLDNEIKYGLIGAKTDKIKNPEIVAHSVIKLFYKNNPKNFEDFYNISISEDVDGVVEQIGKRKNYLIKNGVIDEYRTCLDIVRNWQNGKLKL
jgi:ribosome biogenesis GTPase A